VSVKCQACGVSHPTKILSLGYMPPPNEMPIAEGHEPQPQTWLPTDLMMCEACGLAQLGYVPDQRVAFPEDYPYTSGATPALRRNFEELAVNVRAEIGDPGFVIDIGSNDGTLLECFDCRKLGVEPTAAAHIATAKGIETEKAFFDSRAARLFRSKHGQARVITCANCFAHMPNVHDVIEGIKLLLTDDGMFVSESHYLIDLISELQYDTIYAEHLRYYTVRGVAQLLNLHGLQVVRVDCTKIHGGSIRVYAIKGEQHSPDWVYDYDEPRGHELLRLMRRFADDVQRSRVKMLERLAFLKSISCRIVGVGAPSRGSTVISYLRLDQSIVDYVCEQSHSHKIGRLMPGTDIPVVDEARLYDEQPEAAILFSWHLADELIPKLRARGYHGEIILPCTAEVIEEPQSPRLVRV
jgi:C-methyltransferase C-terminal domain/Putative zinc binding domain/Methyltransferase domain